jgi:hypothetical protein
MSAGAIARVCLVAVAVFAVAWLVVSERDARLLSNGQSLAQGLTSRAKDLCPGARPGAPGCRQFAQAVSDLRGARFLNPDSAPDLSLGIVEGDDNGPRRIASARRVLRSEPQNLSAWVELLAAGIIAGDPIATRDSVTALHRLDPRDFDSRGQLIRS